MKKAILDKLLRIPLKYALLAGVAGSALYWGVLAQDRYVTEARVSVRTLTAPESSNMLKALTGLGTAPRDDEQLIKERLQSLDEALAADSALLLKPDWKNSRFDLFWHLRGNASQEDFLTMWGRMLTVDVAEPSGVLVIRGQGFSPEASRALTARMVLRAESFANTSFNKLASDQLEFANNELHAVEAKLTKSRAEVSAFQTAHNLLDLDAQTKSQSALVAKLEELQVEAQTELAQAQVTQTDTAPAVVVLKAKTRALGSQVKLQKKTLMAGHPQAVDAQWASLKREVEFLEGQWRATQASVERVRVESQRKVKSLIVLQPPMAPEEAVYPSRLLGFFTWAALMALLTGCMWLVRGLVKEQSWRQ